MIDHGIIMEFYVLFFSWNPKQTNICCLYQIFTFGMLSNSFFAEEVDENVKIEELHKRRNFLACFCKLIVYNVIGIRVAAPMFKHYMKVKNMFLEKKMSILKNFILKAAFWLVQVPIWAAPSEFGTYRLCEQRRFRRACASAQSRQNLRCSLIQAVNQEEPSDRKLDPWLLWMAGHAQLKFVMTECSKTQIRLTGPIY